MGSAVNLAELSGSGHRRAHFTAEVLDSAHFHVRPGSAEELSGSGHRRAHFAAISSHAASAVELDPEVAAALSP